MVASVHPFQTWRARLRPRVAALNSCWLASESAKGTIANDDSACDSPYDKNPNPWLLREGANPLNYAHRGGVTDFPENTLYAYYEVTKAGADVL